MSSRAQPRDLFTEFLAIIPNFSSMQKGDDSKVKVIPFFLFFPEGNLSSSFEYSILRELSNLLGRLVLHL